MTTVEQVRLLLEAGTHVVLQRVVPSMRAHELAQAVGGEVVDGPWAAIPGRVRCLDARGWRDARFADWDARRAELAEVARDSALVVLLDVASGACLARAAPHAQSWAGGVYLPPDPAVRPARSDEELLQGERALRIALDRDPAWAQTHAGELVAVDLLSHELFAGRGDGDALDTAREHLDDGVVYLERLP